MEDFIRPNHNPEPKLKPKKTKHIRETLFIVCMIVCLAVGFVSGYVAKKTVPTNSTSKNAESIIDEAYEIHDEAIHRRVDLHSDPPCGIDSGTTKQV